MPPFARECRLKKGDDGLATCVACAEAGSASPSGGEPQQKGLSDDRCAGCVCGRLLSRTLREISALTLFTSRIRFTDDPDHASTANNLAVATHLFDACSYFHCFSSCCQYSKRSMLSLFSRDAPVSA